MNFESYIYPSATYSCTTNFEYGDVDYDGVLTSADVTKVMQVILNYSTISSLQKLLADYNQDGAVNLLDVTALMNVVE